MQDVGLSEFRPFSGNLQTGGERTAVDFRARVDPSGEVEFDFGMMALTRENRFILMRWSGEKSVAACFSLFGVSEDGTEFRTEDLHFISLKHESNKESGDRMRPIGRCSRAVFRCKLTTPADTPLLRMHLKGFRSHGQLHATCPLGTVVMAGQTSIPNPDVITGLIQIKSYDVVSDPFAWRSQTEKLLEHVRRVMSFATAAVLRAPIIEYFTGDVLARSIHESTTDAGPDRHRFARRESGCGAGGRCVDRPVVVRR